MTRAAADKSKKDDPALQVLIYLSNTERTEAQCMDPNLRLIKDMPGYLFLPT